MEVFDRVQTDDHRKQANQACHDSNDEDHVVTGVVVCRTSFGLLGVGWENDGPSEYQERVNAATSHPATTWTHHGIDGARHAVSEEASKPLATEMMRRPDGRFSENM